MHAVGLPVWPTAHKHIPNRSLVYNAVRFNMIHARAYQMILFERKKVSDKVFTIRVYIDSRNQLRADALLWQCTRNLIFFSDYHELSFHVEFTPGQY